MPLRYRLRAVECPSDVINQIGGWLAQGVGRGYPGAILLKLLGIIGRTNI